MASVSSALNCYICVSNVLMRESSDEKSMVASEALFSEPVEIKQRQNRWAQIVTLRDGYSGWIPETSFCQKEDLFFQPSDVVAKVSRLAACIYKTPDTRYGPLMQLPLESRLKVVDSSDERWVKVVLPDGREAFIQKGDVTFEERRLRKEELGEFSRKFLGLPYVWGGRSSFGYDCSGFVQMLYRQMGVNLPRDSKDQAAWERFQDVSLGELELGDLVFFGNERITHVGMSLGGNQFIHSTVAENQPWIRVSDLSEPYWSNHKLRLGRRVVV
jgi:cell wall-associated NlpC family hydrolase